MAIGEGFQYQRWGVSRSHKAPLLAFVTDGLRAGGCTILHASDPGHAPFFISYETAAGEREGILVYAFFANSRATKNRPQDEHRFQIKYGSDTTAVVSVEQDPARLVTTLFVGIDLDRKIAVAVDPVLYDGVPMFISVEFKRRHAEAVADDGWHAWERGSGRDDGQGDDDHDDGGGRFGVETLVGVRQDRFLDLVRFERAACGAAPGHRQLLAERILGAGVAARQPKIVHGLMRELGLGEAELLDMIQGNSRLKMAVRGGVAELHLERFMQDVPNVTDCRLVNAEGRPDLEVRYKRRGPVLIECKNVLRVPLADGSPRVDFQRTRASKADPCSRYYRSEDFSILAACLHAVTERWEFRFVPTAVLPGHLKCTGRISSNIRVVEPQWKADAALVLEEVTRAL
jgi:hypothetical protein